MKFGDVNEEIMIKGRGKIKKIKKKIEQIESQNLNM